MSNPNNNTHTIRGNRERTLNEKAQAITSVRIISQGSETRAIKQAYAEGAKWAHLIIWVIAQKDDFPTTSRIGLINEEGEDYWLVERHTTAGVVEVHIHKIKNVTLEHKAIRLTGKHKDYLTIYTWKGYDDREAKVDTSLDSGSDTWLNDPNLDEGEEEDLFTNIEIEQEKTEFWKLK